jgi:2-polyprenyl-3-methyl-5-hydroxy-6-metoxy-1,4-benzoquinol methylase/uncharacterized protein YbaR (Trm112 family)
MVDVAADLVPLLACPTCRGALRPRAPGLRCEACGRSFAAPDGIPALTGELDARTAAVRAFYGAAPFPGAAPGGSYATLRARGERSEFARLLDRAIAPDATVVEVGCGTGQLTQFLATGDRLVVGADLTPASLRIAAAEARRLGVRRARFVETDLRAPGLRERAFDVVVCSGVLHHTPDPRASFRAIARLLRPGGIVVLGVYNAYARLPHRVRRALARLSGFRFMPPDATLRARAGEPDRRRAWERDQYRHPEEHRHTLREVQGWFAEAGVEYLRTYPTSLVGGAALEPSAGLFEPAPDGWGAEAVAAQLSWVFTLGREGGLFIVVGAAAAEEAAIARPRSGPAPVEPCERRRGR